MYSRRVMIRVAIGLTTYAITCRRDTRSKISVYLFRAVFERLYTDITVDIKLDIRIVGPDDEVDAARHGFDKEPKT